MSDAVTASLKETHFRAKFQQTHFRQRMGVLAALAGIMALLSVFSAGFFLYTAVVVTCLLIISLTLASVSRIGLELHRHISIGEIPLGQSVDVGLTLENKKNFPAFWLFWQDYIDPDLDLQGAACHFKTVPSNQSHDLKYTLHSTRRGLFRVGPVVAETSGPFGLIRRFLVGKQVDFITVLPRIVPIGKGLSQGQRPVHQVPKRRSIFEDPSRFMGMRDYRPGDSLRRIHWRATARSGTIQVKLFEPSVLTGVLLAVDMSLASYPFTRAYKDQIDPLLELTVTAAASLGQYVLTGDQTVGLISNGTDAAELYPEDWQGGTFKRLDQALDHTRIHDMITPYQPVELSPTKGYWQQERLMTALARLMPSKSIELPDLLLTELPRLPRHLVLMIVTPRLDAALVGVVESLKRSGIDTGILWVRLPEDEYPVPSGMPQNVPIYSVRVDEDLTQLGGQTL